MEDIIGLQDFISGKMLEANIQYPHFVEKEIETQRKKEIYLKSHRHSLDQNTDFLI